MIDGQKVRIPLNAPLDVSSSDMLVEVGAPTFLHNRQQYQGKYLPSSVRFEKDGWAVDWDVYNFEVSSEAYALKSTDGSVQLYTKLIKKSDNTRLLQIFGADNKFIGSLIYNRSNIILSGSIVKSVGSQGNNLVLTCEMNDTPFTIFVDRVSGELSVSDDRFVVEMLSNTYSTAKLQITDTTNTILFSTDKLYSASNLSNEYSSLLFSEYVDKLCTWLYGDTKVTYSTDTRQCEVTDDSLDVIQVSTTVSAAFMQLLLNAEYTIKDTPSISSETIYPYLDNITVKQKTAISGSIDKKFDGILTSLQARVADRNIDSNIVFNNDNISKSELLVSCVVPVWFGVNTNNLTEAVDTSKASAQSSITVGKVLGYPVTLHSSANVACYNKTIWKVNPVIWEHCRSTKSEVISDRYDTTLNNRTSTLTFSYVPSVQMKKFPDLPDDDPAQRWFWAFDSRKTYTTTLELKCTSCVNTSAIFNALTADLPNNVFSNIPGDGIILTNSFKLESITDPVSSATYTITGNSEAWMSSATLKQGTLSNAHMKYSLMQGYTSNAGVYACCINGYICSALSQVFATNDTFVTDNNYKDAYKLVSGKGTTPAGYLRLDSASDTDNLINLSLSSLVLSSASFTGKFTIISKDKNFYLFACKWESPKATYFIPTCYVTGKLSDAINADYQLEGVYIDSFVSEDSQSSLDIMFNGSVASKISYNYITNCTKNIDNSVNLKNKWLNDNLAYFEDITAIVDKPVFIYDYVTEKVTAKQGLHFNIADKVVTVTYDMLGKDDCMTVNTQEFILDGVHVTLDVVSKSVADVTFSYTMPLDFTFFAQLPMCLDAAYDVIAAKEDAYYIQHDDNIFVFNSVKSTVERQLSDNTIQVDSPEIYSIATELGYKYIIKFELIDRDTCTLALSMLYNLLNIVPVSFVNDTISFTESGKVFNANILEIEKNYKAQFLSKYVNIKDESLTEHQVINFDASTENTFVRQQWDTNTTTEKFWWIDKDNILILTPTELTHKHKIDKLDHWNGDVWEVVKTYKRFSILTTDTLKYVCSCSYNGSATKFVCLSAEANAIVLKIYNPLDLSTIQNVIKIPLAKETLGNKLNKTTNKLHTYNDLRADSLISGSFISATSIDNKLIVGIHFDKNFNQWAVVINGSSYSVIQGYGFVGVNGDLTGGEIPSKYFNVSAGGFIGTVQPLTVLASTRAYISSLQELYTVKDMIVGNDAQQWYISKSITGIVSHLKYNISKHNFDVCVLPITNNYAVTYASPSYGRATLSRWSFQRKNFTDLFYEANSTWNHLLALVSPSIVFIEPRYSLIAYGQQTLGQAAYVHYNSAAIKQMKDPTSKNSLDDKQKSDYDMNRDVQTFDDPIYTKPLTAVSSDQLTFDVQTIKQSISVGSSFWNESVWGVLTATAAAAVQTANQVMSVNNDISQTTVSDVGHIFGQSASQYLNDMTISKLSRDTLNPTVDTEVTAVKSLDMFFSTSDDQNICAGPGYVNHNFVAQCVAQSVTSTQLEAYQLRTMFLIKAITMLPLYIALKPFESAYKTAEKTADNHISIGYNFFIGGLADGGGTSAAGDIAAGAAVAAYAGTNLAYWLLNEAANLVSTMLDAMGANQFRSRVHAHTWEHSFDLEPKHNYGDKSEAFMYPCFGCDTALSYLDEYVDETIINKPWDMNMNTSTPKKQIDVSNPKFVTEQIDSDVKDTFKGDMKYFIASIIGKERIVNLPEDMACVVGSEKFLPNVPFKNKNISESEPVFATPPIQDYIIDKRWELSQTAGAGMTVWVSCKDTKLLDGPFTNIVVSDDFCGIANSYAAVEVKQGIQYDYLRPSIITPKALAINTSGFNCFYEHKAYHAFDGYGYRTVSWIGAPGMNKEFKTMQYCFITNDRFKRSNKLPANEFLGNFKSDPVNCLTIKGDDEIYSLVTQPNNKVGLVAGMSGEDKDATRYSVPIFTETVNTLPAAIKTLSTMELYVDSGITNPVTSVRDLQMDYKSPKSVDFTIGKNTYRFTTEYICSLQVTRGVTIVDTLVPCLGLEFLGATPYEAYFYSPATRSYYQYTGGTSLQLVDTIERFRNVSSGKYDFVNQEVVADCLATFDRLDSYVFDDIDDADNIIVPRIKDSKFIGELSAPITTIFNYDSWYKIHSLPSGICYQGPNRCIINRFITTDYMLKQIKNNYGKWERVPKEVYHPFRKYKAEYTEVNQQIGDDVQVLGWTHNPFLLVTSALGVQPETDCIFEWEITFCCPVEMNYLYDKDNYAVVNIYAETMTPGGKVCSARPTHVYLTKELFTRSNSFGYYSFRYQSKNGAGNRERLHIWSDQFIAISGLQVEYKIATSKRTEQLTQQVDVQNLKEI